MAVERDWADAYLAQARADLEGAALAQSAPSVFAMLLQMTFEKFAKAALLRSGAITLENATTKHAAASLMIGALRRRMRKNNVLGGSKAWEDVLSLVPELERLHPAVIKNTGPQLEYPFELRDGRVGWPARHLAIAQTLGKPRSGNLGRRVLDFAQRLSDNFETVFPWPRAKR